MKRKSTRRASTPSRRPKPAKSRTGAASGSKRSGRAAKPRRVSKRRAAPEIIGYWEKKERLQDQVDKDRNRRFDLYLEQIASPRAIPGGGRAAMPEDVSAARPPLRILAEGDSWFEYPLRGPLFGDAVDGVIYRLQRLLGYPIANMAHHGDEVRQMLGLRQRREIITRLSNPSVRFDALLFSGGGNDLVGDQLCLLLRNAQVGVPPEETLHPERLRAALQCVEAGYRDLVDIRDRLSFETAIFFQGYDFPPITGKGVCGTGPWLKPSLDFRLVPTGESQFRVVKALLSAFDAMLRRVAADSRDVTVVPTQGTLQPIDADWQNEIHPSGSGFTKIAEKFKAALAARFP